MKNLLINLFLVSTTCFCITSCNDIIERNIAKDNLSVISPSDNYIAKEYNVLFWWEDVRGALHYRIQIAKPDFANIQSLILDTVISNTDYRALITLFPGKYQWKIRAENGSSETPYIIRSIIIDTTKNLTNQQITVTKPADNYYINNRIITFSWPAFPYADRYEYLLTDTAQIKIKSIIITQNSYTDTIDEGRYLWSVRGINTSTNTYTNYSSSRHLHIDVTPPTKPLLLSPISNALVQNPIKLSWGKETDITQDSILITTDSFFQNTVYSLVLTDSTTCTLPQTPINSTLYWKIKSKDKAGNWSGFSDWRKFTVTQ